MNAPKPPQLMTARQEEDAKQQRRNMSATLRQHREIMKTVLVEVIVAVTRHGAKGNDIIEALASKVRDETTDRQARWHPEATGLLGDVVQEAALGVGMSLRDRARLRGD